MDIQWYLHGIYGIDVSLRIGQHSWVKIVSSAFGYSEVNGNCTAPYNLVICKL